MGAFFFIKSGHFTPVAGQKVIKAADYGLMVAAEEALEKARRDGEAIREEARRVFEEEKKRGYAEGLELGQMEMAEQMLETVTRGVDYLEEMEGTIVDLIMNAMNKIIDGFTDKERVVGVVRKSLGYVRSQKRVVLRIAPEDADLVQAEMKNFQLDFPGIGLLDVVADPRLAAGACLMESELGLIDASLKVQLEGIRRAFERQLKQGAGG